MGTVDQLTSWSKCKFCRVLSVSCLDTLEFIERIRQGNIDCPSRIIEPEYGNGDPIIVSLVRNPALALSTKPHITLEFSHGLEWLGPVLSMRTIRGDIVGDWHSTVTPRVIYDNLIWMVRHCDSSHGRHCGRHTSSRSKHTSLVAKKPLSILLVNVRTMCLETADARSACYAALSYVWGQKTMLRCRRENVEALKKPGSLQNAGLSRLVEDVLEVVRGLELEYLWIDALCIVQDDVEHRQAQIERMFDIYSEAYLTIVALSGESTNSPLPGVSASFPLLSEVIDGMLLTTKLSPLAWNAHNRTYEQRGWTFQERLISRRCLFFTERQVYFECGRLSTSELELRLPEHDRGMCKIPFNPLKTWSQALRRDRRKQKDQSIADSFSLEYLDSFCQVLSQYSCRQLTYPSDIENAFLGIQATLNSMLRWSFIGGLPTGVFDWALLWLPLGRLERRTWTRSQVDENNEESHVTQQPPSWSWLGWDGRVSYACYTYHGTPFLQNIRPRVASYTVASSTVTMTMKRSLSAIWHQDVQAEIQMQHWVDDDSSDEVTGKTTLPWLLDPTTVLVFEAETRQALADERESLFASEVEEGGAQLWSRSLCTTTSRGSSRDRGRTRFRIQHNILSRSQSLVAPRSTSRWSRAWRPFTARATSLTSLRSMSSVGTRSRDSFWRAIGIWRERLSGRGSTRSSRARADSPIWGLFGTARSQRHDVDRPWPFDTPEDRSEDESVHVDTRDFTASIEWLNTGPAYGMLRHGLRHDYNDTILDFARKQVPERLELVTLAECDVHQTFRGGQFNEEKLFLQKDRVIVMLILWNDEMTRAERIAIGMHEKYRDDGEGSGDGKPQKRLKTIRLV